MLDGAHPDGAMVLRALVDMASPNLQMRDPPIYRIRHAAHHRMGTRWRAYPTYIYAHPIEDALENITHSFATLEFAEHRAFYDWLLAHLVRVGLVQAPPPRQFEFGRLNLEHVVTSKRKLKALVDESHVQGWDDPRMPTIRGLRRRGYTAAALRRFVEATGASRHEAWVPYAALEQALRDDLEPSTPRAMGVLDPLMLELTNWREVFGQADTEPCTAPVHPRRPDLGERSFSLGPRLWIDRQDFSLAPDKHFHRLAPGRRVRLKYGVIVECTGCRQASDGAVADVQARIVPGTKSGTPGAGEVKVKGTVTWVGAHEAVAVEWRLFDHLFASARPDDSDCIDFRSQLQPQSRRVLRGYAEPSMARVAAEQHLQIERVGYFVSDRVEHRPDAPVFNRITALREGAQR